MKDIVIYLLEVSLCLSIFILIYRIFLRSTTFFRFNRGYLLCGLIASFIIPSVQFYYDVYIPATAIQATTTEMSVPAMETAPSEISIWSLILAIYISGIVVLIIRNLAAYRKLYLLMKSGSWIKTPQFTIIDSKQVNSPFSVFKYIVLNSSKISDLEKDLIIKHEATHIRQKHWFDLFCSECALLLQWFNPLMWLYVHTQKENHEFLADKSVIDTGCTPALYQAVLINQRFQGPVFSFSNSFNYSNHLNRLTMIKKVKSSPWKRISILILVPVFGLFFWVSAKPNYIMPPTTDNNPSATRVETNKQAPAKETEYKSKGNDIANNKTLSIADRNEYGLHKSDNISAVDSLKPIEQDNKKAPHKTVEIKTDKPVMVIDTKKNPPLIIIDDEEVHNGVDHLLPEDIESISVLKDSIATHFYGEKGKNGVILINLKNKKNATDKILTYNGRVMKSGTNQGVATASVIIKGTTTGTITNADGFYEIKAPQNSTLVFSIRGYKKQELKATNLMHVFLEVE